MDLTEIRKHIDEVDRQIVGLLGKRAQWVQQIDVYKKQHNVSALDQARFDQLLQRLKSQARDQGVDVALVIAVYKAIHAQSLSAQGHDAVE